MNLRFQQLEIQWPMRAVRSALVALVALTHGIPPALAGPDGERDGSGVDSGTDKGNEVRKFNDVLADLLNEFSYDLKTNQLQGVKNVSIRRVAVSDTIPKSYESYVESLAAERFRKHSSIRVLQCTNCRVKRTIVERGRLTVTTPINNPRELDLIAAQMGIETWVDVALLYQETSMVLAFNVFDAKTKELLWTKVYNSENLYRKTVGGEDAARARIGPDAQAETKEEERKSRYVTALTAGYFLIPNVKKPSNMLGATLRIAERFNVERSEIGGSVSVVMDPGLFVKDYGGVDGDPAQSGEVTVAGKKETIKPFTIGIAVFGSYVHNFITVPEDFDTMRTGVSLGLGGMFASGYITFTGRGGFVMRFGRHFIFDVGAMYSAPTTLKIKGAYEYKTKGGPGADVTFGLHF